MRIFYVYGYRHPLTKVWRYIGKGQANRLTRHFEYAQTTQEAIEWHNPRLIHWIRKLLHVENLQPEIVRIRENLLERKAYDYEHALILQLGRLEDGGLLLNHTLGGSQGTSGYHWSEEQIQAQSERLSNYFQTPEGLAQAQAHGEFMNELYQTPEGKEIAAQISEALSGPNHPNWGKSLPQSTRDAIGSSNQGKDRPLELREAISQGVLQNNERKRQGLNCSTCLQWHNHPRCRDTKSTDSCAYHRLDSAQIPIPQEDIFPSETREVLRKAAQSRWNNLRLDNSCAICRFWNTHPDCKNYQATDWCIYFEAEQEERTG